MRNVLISLGALAAVGLTGCNSSGSNDPYAKVDYIPVKETEKGNWSFYAPDGKLLYPDEFKNEPSLVIEGYFSVAENDGFTLYHAGDKPEVVGEAEGLKSVGYMSDGLIPVTFPKERISVLNTKGEKVFTVEPVKGKEIISCASGFSEGYLRVNNEDNLEGYLNTKGEVVIQPAYYYAYDFNEGYAVVGKRGEDGDDDKFMVIDTKGEVVFNIRSGYGRYYNQFMYGKLVVRDANDHIVFLDTKGETAFKCPSKVSSVDGYNSKYIIFCGEDSEYGVMDFEGETIIRTKYSGIEFVGDDKFLCSTDDRVVVLDAKGEELLRFDDYESVRYLGKFGYIGVGKRIFEFLDVEGKPVKNAEFTDLSYQAAQGYNVQSDYFNTEAVVADICSMINPKGVGDFAIGEGPGAHFSNPSNYFYRSSVDLDDLDKSGYRYSISARARFSKSMGDWDYAFNGYEYNRREYWNPGCELQYIDISITTQTDWCNDGPAAITNGLKKEGFTLIGEAKGDDYVAGLTKGSVIVCVTGTKGYSSSSVVVGADNARNLEDVKQMIINAGGTIGSSAGNASEAEAEAEVVEAAEVVDSVASYDDF